MTITKPPVLPSWAEAGDKIQPSNAEIQAGWPLSSIPPSRQRFNWLLNFLANGIRYFSRRGLPDYDAVETYMIGDRIIGDDGKTYRSLVGNNVGQTPSTSPTKWERWGFTFNEFLAGVATPPQFDNDTSLATTAFVQQALGNMRGFVAYSASTNLTADDLGKYVICSGSGNTLTLPDLTLIPVGSRIYIQADRTATNGILVTSINGNLVGPGSSVSGTPSTTLGAGVASEFIKIGTGWLVVGGSGTSSLLSTTGYQRLTGGLIIQWGVGSSLAGVATNITFPIAFPSGMAIRGAFANGVPGSGHFCTVVTAGDLKVNMAVESWTAASTRAGAGLQFLWVAFGF